MTRRNILSKGFTLIEMIIAVALASLVLVGAISMTSSMLKQHVATLQSGQISSMTLYSLDAMNRELESASHIESGYPTTAGGPTIAGCMDYSRISGASLDGNTPDYFIYCVDTNANTLWRYYYTGGGCPSPLPPSGFTCGQAISGASQSAIVLNNFYPLPGPAPFFTRISNNNSALLLQYAVGNSTPTFTASITVQPDHSAQPDSGGND